MNAERANIFQRVIRIFIITAMILALSVPLWAAVSRDGLGRPMYVDRQLIITLKEGAQESQLDNVLTEIGARLIKKLPVSRTYLVELLPSRGEEPDVEVAVTRSASSTLVANASPNYYDYPCASIAAESPSTRAIPSDPMYSQQWALRMINMPSVWDVTRGAPWVVVAVLDTGVSSTHPELASRLVSPRDAADGDNNANPSRNPEAAIQEMVGHGTHVAGIIAAQGGNGIGITGVCWDNVKIMPVKIMPDDSTGLPHSAQIEGLEWAKNNGAQVVNMSYGGTSYNDAVHRKLKELDNLGIILVAASGNTYPAPVLYPAAYPEVIAVGAVDPSEKVAGYSCQGPEIDIAAPGGDLKTGETNGILSTHWTLAGGDKYAYLQGTSMACPHVAGAAAMLLSVGVPSSQVKARLLSGARTPNVASPSPDAYGAGILDLQNAITYSESMLRINEPASGSVLDTVAPRFKISYSGVAPESIVVYLDYPDANNDGIPDDPVRNTVIGPGNIGQYIGNGNSGSIEFSLPMSWLDTGELLESLSPGAHKLYVRAQRVDDPKKFITATGVFFVTPRVINSGLHFFSFPYPLAPNTRPEDIFSTGRFTLSRLDPQYQVSSGTYATWNTSGSFEDVPNKYVWPTTVTSLYGTPQYTLKRGTAFWLRTYSDMPVNITSQGVREDCVIRLVGPTGGSNDIRKGWNMIGNPFPFKVDWANVLLSYQGTTLPLMEAAAAGWIRPNIFRYDPRSGYQFQTAPQGFLMPWEGHWVYANVGDASDYDSRKWLLMIIPPLESSGATRGISDIDVGRSSVIDSEWTVRLSARVGEWIDSSNIAGVSAKASDGFGIEDIPEPPPAPIPVNLSFVHRDWGEKSGQYQADIKNSAGSSKVWEFEVDVKAANQEVTLSWPDIGAVPKDVRMTLEDVSAGSKVYMRTRSSYSYDSGDGGIRRFKMTAEPASKGRLLITNVGVTRNRAGSIAISYSVSRDARVEVRIKNAAGRHVRSLGGNATRAAGLGMITWDSRAEDGQSVPTGAYICEIVATDPDGEVAKTVQPVLLK